VLVVWFLVATIRGAWNELKGYQVELRVPWLLVSAGLYLAGLLPCAWVWRRALTALGQSPSWPQVLRAYFVGHLGKYVPGKAMVIVLRVGLLKPAGVEVRAAAVAVFYETLTMMAFGAALAAAIIAAAVREQVLLALLACGLATVSLLPICPPVLRCLMRKLRIGGEPDGGEHSGDADRLGGRMLASSGAAVIAGWIVIGTSLWAVLWAMQAQPDVAATSLRTLALCTAAAALATVAGFLSLLPGGIFVREAILVLLLGEAGYSQADSLIAAVLLRVVWLAAEVLVSAALMIFSSRRRVA
jgi:uncharacterized membrane protein YbhN (UPF0104 family)